MKLKKFLFCILFGLIFNLGFFFIADHVKAESVILNDIISTYSTGYYFCASTTDETVGVFVKFRFENSFYLDTFTFNNISATGAWSGRNLTGTLKIKTSTSTTDYICQQKSENMTTLGGDVYTVIKFSPNDCLLENDTDYWFQITTNDCTWKTYTRSLGFKTNGSDDREVYAKDYTGSISTSTKTFLVNITSYPLSNDCGDCICTSGGGGSGATTSTSTLITSEFLGGQDIGKISAISGTDESGITYTIYSYPNLLFRFIFSVLGLSLVVCCLLIFFKLKK